MKYGSLNIFLLDSSKSMFNSYLINGEQIEGAKAISEQVADGIFSIEGFENAKYFLIILFDKSLKVIVNFLSVKDIQNKYNSKEAFQLYLYSEMTKMKNDKNIQIALDAAFHIAKNFINEEINNINPIVISSFNPRTGEDKSLPLLNCFLYTNEQEIDIKNNPFKSLVLHDKIIYPLSIIFLGSNNTNQFEELKPETGICVIHNKHKIYHFEEILNSKHNFRRFFMFDNPFAQCIDCLNDTLSEFPIN